MADMFLDMFVDADTEIASSSTQASQNLLIRCKGARLAIHLFGDPAMQVATAERLVAALTEARDRAQAEVDATAVPA